MLVFRRFKLFANAFRGYTAKIKPQTLPIPKPKILLQKSGHGSVFPHYAPNSQLLGLRHFVSKINNYRSSGILWLGGQRRFYYVHRYHVERSKPMWFQNLRNALLCSGAFAALCLRNLETLPYTNRKDSVVLSMSSVFDNWLGEFFFENGAKEI